MPGVLDLASPWRRGPRYYIVCSPRPRRVGWLQQPASPEARTVHQKGTCPRLGDPRESRVPSSSTPEKAKTTQDSQNLLSFVETTPSASSLSLVPEREVLACGMWCPPGMAKRPPPLERAERVGSPLKPHPSHRLGLIPIFTLMSPLGFLLHSFGRK